MAMPPVPPLPPRQAAHGHELWPTLRAALVVVALFALAMALSRHFEQPIRAVLQQHRLAGLLVFTATSVLAVLLPVLSNLPLVPLAVLAWGPGWTAALLLLGWVLGSAASFALARTARHHILRHFPAVQRHADIERLVLPRQRLLSLVLLRMTFPVDVLSYALGLFSERTTLGQCALSTALGGAPFALLFAWVPVLPPALQMAVFGGSVLAFVAYTGWMLRRGAPPSSGQ